MAKHTFATKKGKAYYFNSIPNFIDERAENVVGQLVRYVFEINKEQVSAWENQIEKLQHKLKENGVEGDIIFEYDIIRLGKRIDVILLIRNMVFSLEFKNGKHLFTAQDAQQAEDYALDLKNFHKESKDLYVCPILIATDAEKYKKDQSINAYPDKQIYLQRENFDTLIPKVVKISDKYGEDRKIDFDKWFNSPYYPTPTIISAAVEAYSSHNLSEIARSEAAKDDIEKCEDIVNEIIDYARNNSKKCLIFITGVPGAGKTLVGLDIVAKSLGENKDEGGISSYLSGNGPLVEVLREALKKSAKAKFLLENNNKESFYSNFSLTSKEQEITKLDKVKRKKEINTAISLLIQSSYHFKKEYSVHNNPPVDHILVFDEAQRVWSKEKMKQKHSDDEYYSVSEPHLLMNIMSRHNDWAVMVCLVGLGQDIYDGEVGINEWFRCGLQEFDDWEIYYSPELFIQNEDRITVKDLISNSKCCHEREELHLKTDLRSFRADKLSKFIDDVIDNNPIEASMNYALIKDNYPLFVTRDYKTAKKWARSKVRGSQRCGVMACSSAQRLKPEGIYVPTDIDVKNWFLAPSDDLRSSNMMEIVASEFKVQGLEIDWGVVCWDADLRRTANGEEWDYYNFRGTKWNKRNKPEQKRYLLNSYRVLLTRSRQGMVIFVPYGVPEDEDPTRNHKYYDNIYNYLLSCGIEELEANCE